MSASSASGTPDLSVRHADLVEFMRILRDQHSIKRDMVVPSRQLTSVGGRVQVIGAEDSRIDADGVTTDVMILRPTSVGEASIADKLGIPLPYLRRIREEGRFDLYDANLDEWFATDDRWFLLRGMTRLDSGDEGVLRALLSDSYRIVDNLDVLMAVLDGVRAAGVPVEIADCDLTERRMYVKIRCPEVAVHAADLLRGYTSPFTGARGSENPTVFAGFVVSNSETGNGSFSLTPRLTVQICDNGLTMSKDTMREVHLGSKMPQGAVRWGIDTHRALLDLVGKQTRDAVRTFLDPAYVRRSLTEIGRDAGVRITDPVATIEHVGKTLRYTADHQSLILSHFIQGGQTTSGGVLQAVTSAAQLVEDADVAHDMERSALRAMAVAAAHAS